MTIKKLFINLFTTLFISGATLGFLLATERPFPQTQTEKYILFERCKPYFNTTIIPKTINDFDDLNKHYHTKVNSENLCNADKWLYRAVFRFDSSEKGRKTSKAQIVSLDNLGIFSNAFYNKQGALAAFYITTPDLSYFCTYNSTGQLIELTRQEELSGYVNYDYKGKILKTQSYKGFYIEPEY